MLLVVLVFFVVFCWFFSVCLFNSISFNDSNDVPSSKKAIPADATAD